MNVPGKSRRKMKFFILWKGFCTTLSPDFGILSHVRGKEGIFLGGAQSNINEQIKRGFRSISVHLCNLSSITLNGALSI